MDYDQLVKEVVDWSHRDDLNTKVPLFIEIAENNMYSNPITPLKVRSMETVTTLATTGQLTDLPDGFESARSIKLLTDHSHELKYQAPEQMNKFTGTGLPSFYTIIGGQIELNMTPDTSYNLEIQYFKKADKLSKAIQTNQILEQHPSIYLYGALAVLFGHAQDTEQEMKYAQKFIDAIIGANKADKKGRYGPAPSASLEYQIV